MWWPRQGNDEPAETCAELGRLAREAVERIRPEADEVVRALDDLVRLAGDLEARGEIPYEPWITYRDTVILAGHDAARQLQVAHDGLREIADVLRN